MPEGLLAAAAFVMILEGLLPFVAPRLWRETFSKLVELSDGQIRFVGRVAILVGLAGIALLYRA